MKKIKIVIAIAVLFATLSTSGCLLAAAGWLGYEAHRLANSHEAATTIERERMLKGESK